VAFNGCENRVEIVEAAVSSRAGTVPFFVSPFTNMASLARTNVDREWLRDPVREIEVQSVTLDAFCDGARIVPDVLKIDVEGAELQVLCGATELLRNSRPTIFCEVHPRQMANLRGGTLDNLHAFLHSIGYVNELITEPDNGGIFHARMTHVNGPTNGFDECSS
jgi:FkbM family methyltransferase